MIVRNLRWLTVLPLLLAGAAASACTAETTTPVADLPVTIEPDIAPVDVTASFTLTIDPTNAALLEPTLDPKAEPTTVKGGTSDFGLRAFVKHVPARPELLWVELYFENRQAVAVKNATVEVGAFAGSDQLFDLTRDPLAEATTSRTLDLGGLSPEGVSRVVIGLAAGQTTVSLPLTLKGTTTKRLPTTSGPIAVTPDGKEAWTVFPDGDVVAAIDTATDKRVAKLAVAGHPSSLSITPDGKLVVVASERSNRVSIIDRETRSVVQTFGEADGLGRELRHLVLTPDGSRAFVSGYVSDTVTSLVRHGDRYRVETSVAVGRRPGGLSVSPDGKVLFVAHFLPRGTVTKNDGWVSIVAIDTLSKARELSFVDPLNADKAHCLADVFGVSASRVSTEGVPTQLAGVFLNPAGTMGWTPGTRIAGAPIWERGAKANPDLSSIVLARPGEITPPFLFFTDTRNPEATERLLSIGLVERPVSLDYLRCEKFGAEIEFADRDIVPTKPDQQVNRFPAFPTAVNGLSETGPARFVGFTRGGRRALILSYTADEIVVYDAMTLHPATQRHFMLSGSNPTGLAITPDGKKAYVAYANSTFASALDLSAYADPKNLPAPSFVPYEYREVPELPTVGAGLGSKQLVRYIDAVPDLPQIKETTTVPVADADPVEPEMRRGKILFESSNPEKYPDLSKDRLGTCSACHPNGGSDGTLWGTMEGERRTISLAGGVAGRGWLHASATHVDASEFSSTIVTERLGGHLTPEDTKAMSKFISFGIPRLQGPRVDEALAATGKAVFQKSCSGCHAGEKMTSGNPDPKNEWGGGIASGPTLFDVGTRTDNASAILGTFFESLFPPLESKLLKTLRGDRDLGPGDFVQETLDFRQRPARKAGALKAPSLVNAWDNVVFFHDGRFDKIEDAVHYLNDHLDLGLSATDEHAVVEYLRTL
ncbi:MAG: hypothetical protein ABJE95_08775 [Byssovorax sp.]